MNTLQDNQAFHAQKVRNFTVANLKADADFMQLCRDDRDFRDWVLEQRPDMAKKPPEPAFKMKFKGIVTTEPCLAESQPAKPQELVEEVPKMSKTEQIIADLKVYREKKGFL